MDIPANAVTVLSLCSGGAGLDHGLKLAVPSARTICWVEWESFAASELVRRMEAGELDEAPMFTDLRRFDGKPWRGVVDCIAGGFPCQPHSVAGKRRGRDDERDLWPEVRRIVEEVRPSFVFFENVPGLLTIHQGEFFGTLASDLERMGYEITAGLFAASEVGTSHKRERLFILGVADGKGKRRKQTRAGYSHANARGENRVNRAKPTAGSGGNVDDTTSTRRTEAGSGTKLRKQRGRKRLLINGSERVVYAGSDGRGIDEPGARTDRRAATGETGSASGGLSEADIYGDCRFDGSDEFAFDFIDGIGPVEDPAWDGRHRLDGQAGIGRGVREASDGVANTKWPGHERPESARRTWSDRRATEYGGSVPLFPPGPGELERWGAILREHPELAPAQTIADFRLLSDGLADDRTRLLRMLGNGVVPLQAAYAFVWLWCSLRGVAETNEKCTATSDEIDDE